MEEAEVNPEYKLDYLLLENIGILKVINITTTKMYVESLEFELMKKQKQEKRKAKPFVFN